MTTDLKLKMVMPHYSNWEGAWVHRLLLFEPETPPRVTATFPTEAQARAALLIHILEQEKEHD